jgi:hypothetical protein
MHDQVLVVHSCDRQVRTINIPTEPLPTDCRVRECCTDDECKGLASESCVHSGMVGRTAGVLQDWHSRAETQCNYEVLDRRAGFIPDHKLTEQ